MLVPDRSVSYNVTMCRHTTGIYCIYTALLSNTWELLAQDLKTGINLKNEIATVTVINNYIANFGTGNIKRGLYHI